MAKIMDTTGQDRVIAPKKTKKFWIVLLAVGVLVIGAAVFSPTLKRWSSADTSFDRDRLRFATVSRGNLVRDLSADGRIVATSYPTIYSPAQGTVTMDTKAGHRVERGQLLAKIDSPELSNALQQETSQLAAMEAELSGKKIESRTANLQNKQDVDLKKLRWDTAKRELDRQQKTFDQGLTSRMDLDKAQDDLAIAELEYHHAVESAQLQRDTLKLGVRNTARQLERQQLVVDEAQRRVGELNIKAPVSGVVGSVSVDPKDIVARNQELLTVIDLSAFEISISIPENYADEVGMGAIAEITYEGQIYKGKITSISPEVSNSLVEGRMVFDGELPTGLKQNQRVSARIILSSLNNVLSVRRGPFLESGGGRKVYVVEDGMAILKEVRIGSSSLSEIEVKEGLQEGDVIVISDTSRFKNANSVLLRN